MGAGACTPGPPPLIAGVGEVTPGPPPEMLARARIRDMKIVVILAFRKDCSDKAPGTAAGLGQLI
jgi:hypothetical protein